MGLLALSSSEAPAYVGSSSGLSLAADLGEMVQTSVWNQFISRMQQQTSTATNSSQNPTAKLNGPSELPGATHIRDRPTRVEDLLPSNVEPPTDEMGARIIETYFARLHTRYPFLDRKKVWQIHEDRWRLAKSKREDLTRSDRFAIFKLHLVYAIGATMLQLSEKYAYTTPEVNIIRTAPYWRTLTGFSDSTPRPCSMFLRCARHDPLTTSRPWFFLSFIISGPRRATACGT